MGPTRLPSTHNLHHQSSRQRSSSITNTKIYPRIIRRGFNMRKLLFSSSALLILSFLIVATTVQADGHEQPRRSIRHTFSRRQVKALPSKAKTTSTVTTPQPQKLLRGGSMVLAPSTMIRPIQTFLTALGEVKSHLAAAAVARSSSLLACYPIDTVKTRIQTSTPNPFRIAGLYGGIGSCLFGQIPYAALTFGSYEQ